jgi:hypothetical protein
MNRIVKLDEFCNKIGVFKTKSLCSEKFKFQNDSTDQKKVEIGAYGHLLLNQIKNEWLKTNLTKFENSFLVDWIDLAKQQNTSYYLKSMNNLTNINQSCLSLVNLFKSNPIKSKHFPLDEDINFFNKHLDEQTILQCYHFYDHDQGVNNTLIDAFTFWNRERNKWWCKLLSKPENISTKQTENHQDSSEVCLIYNMDDVLSDKKVTKKENLNLLENIQFVELSKNNNNYLPIGQFCQDPSIQSYKRLIVTRTSAEIVLENLLLDSIDIDSASKKVTFNLDYRLAPFKACILYADGSQSSSKMIKMHENLKTLVYDLKKLFYAKQINVFLKYVQNEDDIHSKYNELDEIGVPFAIHVTPQTIKDGICYLRNRDTSFNEKTHINSVIKQLSAISNALSF